MTFAVLFVAAFVGGVLNAVAGGGSFLALPALLYARVPPVVANATTTFALWPGSLSSAFAYRREIAAARSWLMRLGAVSIVGGLLGGLLLVRTSDSSFVRLLPWLMLLGAATFTFGGPISARLRGRNRAAEPPQAPAAPSPGAPPPALPWWALPLQLVIATYGGYFGGGIGIMMLATLAIAGMSDIHEMNGLKSILAVAINGVALAAFVAAGSIAWTAGLVMVGGGIAGGYVGAAAARGISARRVRQFVIITAWALTLYFFIIQPAGN